MDQQQQKVIVRQNNNNNTIQSEQLVYESLLDSFHGNQQEDRQDSRNSSYEEIESIAENGQSSLEEERIETTDLTNGKRIFFKYKYMI